jgi:hypothetical protein
MAVVQTWSEDDVDYETEAAEVQAADPQLVADDEGVETVASSDGEEGEGQEEAELPQGAEPKNPGPEAAAKSTDDILIKIWNAEMRCRGKEAVVEDLKEQLKWAKSELDGAVAELRKLANSAHTPMPLFDQEPVESEEADQEVVTVESEPMDDAWRSRDFIEFIRSKSISGLGEKKLEALGDAIQTFGDFEDLRQQASLNHLPLYDLMPDGFGAKVTEAIENAYLEAQWNQSIDGESDDLPEVDDPPAEEPTEEFDLDSL